MHPESTKAIFFVAAFSAILPFVAVRTVFKLEKCVEYSSCTSDISAEDFVFDARLPFFFLDFDELALDSDDVLVVLALSDTLVGVLLAFWRLGQSLAVCVNVSHCLHPPLHSSIEWLGLPQLAQRLCVDLVLINAF